MGLGRSEIDYTPQNPRRKTGTVTQWVRVRKQLLACLPLTGFIKQSWTYGPGQFFFLPFSGKRVHSIPVPVSYSQHSHPFCCHKVPFRALDSMLMVFWELVPLDLTIVTLVEKRAVPFPLSLDALNTRFSPTRPFTFHKPLGSFLPAPWSKLLARI